MTFTAVTSSNTFGSTWLIGESAPSRASCRGANASISGIASMIGPGLFSLSFAWAIRPDLGLNLPGTPFVLAGRLLLAACVIAWKATRAA